MFVYIVPIAAASAHLKGSLGSSSDRSVECTLTPVILDVGVCPCQEELLHVVPAAAHGGEVERSTTVVIGSVQLHPGTEESIHRAVEGRTGERASGAAGIGVRDKLHCLCHG